MRNINETIPAEMAGQRIDRVAIEFSQVSRTRIQQLIKQGLVEINDEAVKNSYRVKAGDELTVTIPDAVAYNLKPVEMPLDIRYEDEDVIVINKPRGLIVHPTASTTVPTLVEGVLYYCHDLSGINGVMRPGVVHRIDKDTTGLIIMAKNDKAHQALSEQLKDKTMNRRYLAIVNGVIGHDEGTIDAPIGRDPADRQKMAVTDQNSRSAVTQFFVRKRYREHTLIECRLLTGRTHQIRVHMQYIGYPVVNDPKYTSRKLKGSGQMLHAYQLTFIHPTTHQSVTVECDPPQDFQDYLANLDRTESD